MNERDLLADLWNRSDFEALFAELVTRYQERLYWHIRKIVVTHENADDVLQNTFIRVYKSLPKFRSDSAFLTWMYRIAYNEALRFLERDKRNRFLSLNDLHTDYLSMLKADITLDTDEVQHKLHSAMGHLTDKQRHVFQMKYFDYLKFHEIAEILDMKQGTVKSVYYKAIAIIEKNVTHIELSFKNEV